MKSFTNQYLQYNKLITRCNIGSIFDAAIDGLITLNIVAGDDVRYITLNALENYKIQE